jgi:branched-chain amino acid transport system permease protein
MNVPKLFPSVSSKVAIAVLAAVVLMLPFQLTPFWVNALDYVLVFALGAIGLNLLTGFAGQISLGHAFFMGVGAYVAVQMGSEREWSVLIYLPAAAVLGAVVGAAIGPFALRLRGDYLAIITLGLLYFGLYLFDVWHSVTGGGRGISVRNASVAIGPIDFTKLDVFGHKFTRDEGLFYFFAIVLAFGALLAKNIVRSRPGRALQAVRDRDLAAEVVGVSLFRYKVAAFSLAGAYGATAGAMYAVLQQFVSPKSWDLLMSIHFLAIIIVGGLGSISGTLVGAVLVGLLPKVLNEYSDSIPFVYGAAGGDGLISAPALSNLLQGALIVLFLVLHPYGLASIFSDVKRWAHARFRSTRTLEAT